jgi:predicted exporter
VALLGAALAMLVYCAVNLRLGTDITRFMPDGRASELASLSTRLADSPFTRTLVLSVSAREQEAALSAARELALRLREHPDVAFVRDAMDEDQLRQVYDLYFPRRLYFLSHAPDEIPALLGADALRERARELKRRLTLPAAGMLEPLVASDPIGCFDAVLERFRGGEPALRVEHGQLVTRDGRHAIVIAASRSSAFDSAAQARLLGDLERWFAEIEGRLGSDLELELSSAGRFALAVERSMKRDVAWIGSFAFLGVAALFVTFVGSLRGFLIVSLAPLAGMLVATTLGIAVFGNVDGLTMVFGTSLMGIAVDYSNHLLIHHGLAGGEPAARTARRLSPTLLLGALTTVASFVGLSLTAFPAFREMSFFAGVGVLTALATTLFVLPPLLDRTPPLPARSQATAAALARAFSALERLPRPLLAAAAVAGLLFALAWPRLEWTDDMSRLTRFDPELQAEDQRVRDRVARLEGGRFVVGVAADEAEAVAMNDRIQARLAGAVDAGALAGTRSLQSVLWSEELQRSNWERIAGEPGLADRVEEVFAAEGFRASAFAPFREALAAPPPPPLALADLRQSPLADLLAPFVVPVGDATAVVTYLRDLRSPEALRAALDGLDRVYLLDHRSILNDVYREFRESTLRQLLVGAGLVLLLLAVRYRAPRPVLAAFLPSAVVAVAVLGILALSGQPANLLHAMSLVMVTGMGVDYGVFLVDSAGGREEVGATMLSLLMSCLTTTFVFGTLALSSQPSLQAMGVTTGVGILLSYLLAPLALGAAGLAGAVAVRRPAADAR